MATCKELFDKSRNLILAGAAGFAGVATAIGSAISLNAGVFSAPGAPAPMGVAAGLATATAIALSNALLALNEYERNGDCLSPSCKAKLDNVRTALIAATASVTALASSCAAIALIAWIPYFALVPMSAAYATAGATAVSLIALAPLLDALAGCQVTVTVTVKPQPLEGEKISDPWFLRLGPAGGSDFAAPTKSTAQKDSGLNLSNQYLNCAMHDVQEWQVAAEAHILLSPPFPVHFSWRFGGKDVSASASQVSPTSSTLVLRSAPLGSPAMLEVTATDGGSYSRTKKAEIDLPPINMVCNFILQIIPGWDQVPTEPPGPVEISAKLQELLDIARRAPRPQIPSLPMPGDG